MEERLPSQVHKFTKHKSSTQNDASYSRRSIKSSIQEPRNNNYFDVANLYVRNKDKTSISSAFMKNMTGNSLYQPYSD